jgi:predicted HAD superfamily Cof-like phosphohydrolase
MEAKVKELHELLRLGKIDEVSGARNEILWLVEEVKFSMNAVSASAKEDPWMKRLLWHLEEVVEQGEAMHSEDHVKLLDAFVDSVYITISTAIMLGMPFDRAFDRVHESNMTKQPDYPRFKGPNFRPPVLEDLL